MQRFGQLAVAAVLTGAFFTQTPLPYRDPARSVDERVADLLGRMTLEEKVAQLVGIWQKKPSIQDAEGRFDPAKAKTLLEFGIGEVSRPSETNMPAG